MPAEPTGGFRDAPPQGPAGFGPGGFASPGYASPGYANPRYASPGYGNPHYASPGFAGSGPSHPGPRFAESFAPAAPPFIRPVPYGQAAYLTDPHGRVVYPGPAGYAVAPYPVAPYPVSPYPVTPYPAAAYGPAYVGPLRRTNGLAIASFVLGLLWIWWLGSILAVVFGHVALHQMRRRGESGSGLAIAGLVLGWVGLAALAFVVGLGIANS